MATTSVTFRIDEQLKKQAESAFESMGLNMTVALTAFVKAVLRERRIPFELAMDDYTADKRRRQVARRELASFAGALKRDIDIKAELAEWRDAKYGDSGRH